MKTRFIFSRPTGILGLIFFIVLSTFSSCKKYEDGPSFTLLPARVRIANEWKSFDSTGYSYLKLTLTGKVKVKFVNGGDWVDYGDWEFVEDRNVLRINGFEYIISRLTNKELWITSADFFGYGPVTTKYESTSFL